MEIHVEKIANQHISQSLLNIPDLETVHADMEIHVEKIANQHNPQIVHFNFQFYLPAAYSCRQSQYLPAATHYLKPIRT